VSDKWHIGRKAIIKYLKPYLALSDDQYMAWKKVRRWRINYGLPILSQPTNKPYIDAEEFETWWKEYLENRKARER
jgi:hypothetical protein